MDAPSAEGMTADERGEDRGVLELTPFGTPQLLFFDKSGALRWKAP